MKKGINYIFFNNLSFKFQKNIIFIFPISSTNLFHKTLISIFILNILQKYENNIEIY
jgi:hypothetical protein